MIRQSKFWPFWSKTRHKKQLTRMGSAIGDGLIVRNSMVCKHSIDWANEFLKWDFFVAINVHSDRGPNVEGICQFCKTFCRTMSSGSWCPFEPDLHCNGIKSLQLSFNFHCDSLNWLDSYLTHRKTLRNKVCLRISKSVFIFCVSKSCNCHRNATI